MMKSSKEMAEIWNVSERTVTTFCKSGKVPGAIKALPIGISDYVRAQSKYYYVDKTMMIKEFLDQKPLVTLFTRPRRFGKIRNYCILMAWEHGNLKTDTNTYYNITLFLSANIERNYWFRDGYQMI